jgi:hypothetical protein
MGVRAVVFVLGLLLALAHGAAFFNISHLARPAFLGSSSGKLRSAEQLSTYCVVVGRGWSWHEIAAFILSLETGPSGAGAGLQCGVVSVTQTDTSTVAAIECIGPGATTLANVTSLVTSSSSSSPVLVAANTMVSVPPPGAASVTSTPPPPPPAASTAGVQTLAPANLDRIDARTLPLDGLYHYNGQGEGQTLYVIDTGINPTHVEFAPNGRAVALANTIDGSGPLDCHGHGSHVASIAAGFTFGVAKAASIRGIKALDCSGMGTVYSVASALAIVQSECTSAPDSPFVINLSLNGGASSVLDNALASILAQCHACAAVAAGNSYGADACNYSPSRVSAALTVGSLTAGDATSDFSNIGSCVDLYAPGENVIGASYQSPTATVVFSGTSQATPIVAGTCLVVLGQAVPAWQPGNVNAGAVVMAAVKQQATALSGGRLLDFAYWDASALLAPHGPVPPPPPPAGPVPPPAPPVDNTGGVTPEVGGGAGGQAPAMLLVLFCVAARQLFS